MFDLPLPLTYLHNIIKLKLEKRELFDNYRITVR